MVNIVTGRELLKSLSIRLPEDMYKQIQEEAKEEKRTLNAQVNYLLERIVKAELEREKN
ncbi:hypothetical protein GF348_09330 [candidate division KSB3 bacterium]|nr:hypothetical protein [candidate division KSB3 bacterium]